MPEKFTAKNFSYNRQLPSFLTKLQAEVSGSGRAVDPAAASGLNRNRKRVRDEGDGKDDDDDGPLVVDESGNTVELDNKQTLLSSAAAAAATAAAERTATSADGKDKPHDSQSSSHAAATTGTTEFGSRKRRTAKVIPEAEVENPETGGDGCGSSRGAKLDKKKPSKKPKKVALSFEQDDL